MNYQEFLQTIEKEVANRIDEHFTIRINPVAKNNGKIYDGLIINNPNCNVAPTIFLNPYYHRYLSGISINSILDDIISTYDQFAPKGNFDLCELLNYECVKNTVIIRMINFDKNIEKLNNIPFFKYHDLAVTFFCYLTDFQGVSGTICVTNDIFDSWKVDLDTLFSDAIINTERLFPYELINIDSLLSQHNYPFDYPSTACNMYILTNHTKSYGSTCILYPGLLEKLAKELDCDLLMIPSSIHEFLIIPLIHFDMIEIYNEFVNEVNATEIADEEILSNHVYQFSREKNGIISHYLK